MLVHPAPMSQHLPRLPVSHHVCGHRHGSNRSVAEHRPGAPWHITCVTRLTLNVAVLPCSRMTVLLCRHRTPRLLSFPPPPSPPPSPPPCLRFFSPLLHSQQYSFDDQNYLFMLPIVLHRAPTRKNILGLTMQHFKMLHKVQADVSAEEVMHPPAWLPLPLLSLACFSATGHATCEAVPATTRYCGDGQT